MDFANIQSKTKTTFTYLGFFLFFLLLLLLQRLCFLVLHRNLTYHKNPCVFMSKLVIIDCKHEYNSDLDFTHVKY